MPAAEPCVPCVASAATAVARNWGPEVRWRAWDSVSHWSSQGRGYDEWELREKNKTKKREKVNM